MKFTKDVSKGQEGFQKLPEKLILKGARVVDPGQSLNDTLDIYLLHGVIEQVGKINPQGFEGEVLDLNGMLISPGWMDMHVHLREPGREDEETIKSGSLTAANGGFTALCCMPDTMPAIDTQEIILYIKDRARGSLVDVHPVGAITKKREGLELAEILDLVEQGAVAISDDTAPVMSAEIMRRALEYSRMAGIPVVAFEEDTSMTGSSHMNEGYTSTCLGLGGMPSVAEEIMIARDIMLTEYSGSRLHIAHISTRKGVELVRQAKTQGIAVTAEVTPHHIALTEEQVRSFDTNTKVRPPLRTDEDVQAILEGLRDGTIDTIASDHSPHAWEEKAAEYIYAPFGIIGLETALGITIGELVHQKVLDIAGLITKYAINPYRILGLSYPAIIKGNLANLSIFDPDAEWKFDPARSLSKSSNSPFMGKTLKGKPFAVINNRQYFRSVL